VGKGLIVGITMSCVGLFSSAAAAFCQHISISANPDYPPYQWVHDGEFHGASIDLTRQIFQDLGVEVDFVQAGPWSRVVKLAQDHRLDMVLTVRKTPELEETLTFTKRPLFPNTVSVFARKADDLTFDTWNDLKGLYGGRALGRRVGGGFDDYARDYLWLEDVTESALNMRKLLAGRISYYVEAYYPGLADVYLAKLEDEIEPLETPLMDGYLYAAFAPGSPCAVHLDAVSERYGQVLDMGKADGLLRNALFEWLVQNQDRLTENTAPQE